MDKKENFQVRQGDVLLIKIDALPQDIQIIEPSSGLNLLALGEVSGHAHQIKSKDSIFFAANDNIISLAMRSGMSEPRNIVGGLRIIGDDAVLWHGTPRKNATEPNDPDHEPISLPPGDYLVCLPREYSDEEEFVRVAD